jgi:methylated-DNA-[protein]-cysteine S-methyltransferase
MTDHPTPTTAPRRGGTAPSRESAVAVPREGAVETPLERWVLLTPAGDLTVLLTPEDGVVRASGFTGADALTARLAPELRARGTDGHPSAAGQPVADAVQAWSTGALDALDAVPVAQPGGPFLQEAWRVMRDIRPGTTSTYTGLAGAAGRPAAVRAAGSACARNLVAPFVPCHRVVRTDGTPGGYAYGLGVKEALLAHERGA